MVTCCYGPQSAVRSALPGVAPHSRRGALNTATAVSAALDTFLSPSLK